MCMADSYVRVSCIPCYIKYQFINYTNNVKFNIYSHLRESMGMGIIKSFNIFKHIFLFYFVPRLTDT